MYMYPGVPLLCRLVCDSNAQYIGCVLVRDECAVCTWVSVHLKRKLVCVLGAMLVWFKCAALVWGGGVRGTQCTWGE